MNIANRSFDVATYLAESAARRRRLMNPPNAIKAVPLLTVVPRVPERPLWQTQAISFDAHVLAYQWYLAETKANRAQEYIRQRCVELGADYATVTDKGRAPRDITDHRHLIWYELKTKFQISYPRIVHEFGGIHHTSVMAGVARIAKIKGEERPAFISGTERLLSDPGLKQEIMDDYDRGMSVDDLADKFAISEQAIVTVAKMEDWYRPYSRPWLRGMGVRTASVNMEALRRDYVSGVPYRQMIERHGISEKTIRKLRNKNGWGKRSTK